MKYKNHLLILVVFWGFLSTGLADERKPFILTLEPHKPVFIANTWFLEDDGNDRGYRNEELIVQFSLKKNIYNLFYFGYSQKLFWQLFDRDHSHPIREINYNPEFFLDYKKLFNLDLLRVGVWEHESNGEQEEHDENGNVINKSRTWNRYYLHVFKASNDGSFGANLKVWGLYDRKSNSYGSFYEDNKDIGHYLGMGELSFFVGTKAPRISGMVRRGWGKGTETIRLTARYPLYELVGKKDNGIDLFAYFFSGYGESLIDYNEKSRRVGIGFSVR